MHSQQYNNNMMLQRQGNSQVGVDQGNYQAQMQNIQPQQQHIQQMPQYPANPPQLISVPSNTSQGSAVNHSSQRVNSQNLQYKQSSQQINMSQQQQQLQVQGDSYIHTHQLQNQPVQQIQQPNQLNQMQSSGGSGVNMAHGQQFSHHSSQQSQQSPIQSQIIQNQQLNYQSNQSQQQQGIPYVHPNVSSKQQQPSQVLQQQIPVQLTTSQSSQQYQQQQDSRRNSSRSDKNSQINCAPPSQTQQQSLVFTNQGGICSDKNGPYGALEQFVEPIYEDFVYLTEKILDKTMKSANKQLQDTLMNYFLENHVSNLIIKEMNCISKRAVRYEIEKTMQKNKTAKYMNLLNAFEAKVKQFAKEKAYENLLMQLITDENSGSKQSEQWKTLVRKRILALLLYIHWSTPNAETIFNDFFAIWDLIYPNHPLPQKVKKSAQASGSNPSISSQLAFQNQNQQQQQAEKPSNPNKAMKRNKQKIIENMNLSQTSLSSQATTFNSQSTSLFQNTYTTASQRTQKEQKMTSSQGQASSELHRSSVKSEKDVPSVVYTDMNQYGQQGQYQQQQGVVYQNQRNQIYLNQNHQQNLNDGVPLQQTSSGFYSNQNNQQYDYNQNYYGNQQGSSQNYDQNYLIQGQNTIQQQPVVNARPSNQIFKGRMRSQSWDDLNNKKDEYNSPQNIQSNLINQQQQGGYYNQPQSQIPTYYQQPNQPYVYDQVGEYYDPNLTNQYTHPQLIQQNSQGYYTDYQNNVPQQPQQNVPIRRQSNTPQQQVVNDPNQQQQIQNPNYGYVAQNQNYQHQQYQQNPGYHNSYPSGNQQYQQVQKIPFYQNNLIYDIQEVKQEGTPSSQNTQESNNNQFFHMDKIILPDPESPEQRLKRGSQTNPQTNYTPLNQNTRTRYSLQYNQQEGSIMQFQQQQSQGKNIVQQPQQFQQAVSNQNLSGQKVQYDQSGAKYNQVPINNTKQEEDLYSSQSNYSVSSSQKSRSNKPSKASNSNQNYEASSGNDKYPESSQQNKNGNYIIAKQEEIDQVNNGESQSEVQNDLVNPDQLENKKKSLSAQLSVQQPAKGKDQRASSPSITVTQSNDNQNKLQQIQLHPVHPKEVSSSNSKRTDKVQEKISNQNMYQQGTINEDDKEDSMPRCQDQNGSSDEYYQSQNDEPEAQIQQNNQIKSNQTQAETQNQENGNNLNQNQVYRHPSKERSQVINNNLFQDFQQPEDLFLNPAALNTNLLSVQEDKFIRNSQRQNTGASCMSIESEKTPFKRSDTRNMTGLSNISIESDKDGRTPSQINRSKFFFRHQNSLEFPSVIGVRSNVRQGTAISNISDGLGAEMLGSQTNINQFFIKRSNFKQFSGISHISIEGGDFNQLQMMQTSNQSQNFGNISRSQLRKRTNLSVDSLASFNIKPDKDIQNLSFDLENLSIHNQQMYTNGQILPSDAINENSNILDDKSNNNIFQYNYSPNNEILP